jgi:hypothetical protein
MMEQGDGVPVAAALMVIVARMSACAYRGRDAISQRSTWLFDIYGRATVEGNHPRFTLTIDDDGLAGTGTLF